MNLYKIDLQFFAGEEIGDVIKEMWRMHMENGATVSTIFNGSRITIVDEKGAK